MAKLDGEWLLMFGEEEIARFRIADGDVHVLSDPRAEAHLSYEQDGATIGIVRDCFVSTIELPNLGQADRIAGRCRSPTIASEGVELIALSVDTY